MKVDKKEESYNEHLECLWELYKHIRTNLNPNQFRITGRCVGSAIYDLTNKHTRLTGYESQASLDRRKTNPKYTPTKEHFIPCQFAGEFILHHIQEYGDINFKYFKLYADIFRQLHLVTKEENQSLRYYQKSSRFVVPEIGYEERGIVLVETTDNVKVTHLRDTAPIRVLKRVYGDRYKEVHKYMLTR